MGHKNKPNETKPNKYKSKQNPKTKAKPEICQGHKNKKAIINFGTEAH